MNKMLGLTLRLAFLSGGAAVMALGCTTGGADRAIPNAGFDVGPRDADMDADAEEVVLTPVVETCGMVEDTIGSACNGPLDCDDGCFCNGEEFCNAGVCERGEDPCADDVECTEVACVEETNSCFTHPLSELCQDGDLCNGAEICDPSMGCVSSSPLYCNDDSSCTVDACDSERGCVHTPRDLDMDGFVSGNCGGMDCDDDPRFGVDVNPMAAEICDNRRDDDCDGARDFADDECEPTNDTCETATPIPGPGTYPGSARGLAADYTFSCQEEMGSDAVFSFTLEEMKDVRLSVAGGTDVTVAIRPAASCATGPDDKCANGTNPEMLRRSMPAGDYNIIVRSPSGVPFDLTLNLSDPTPIPPIDICGDGTSEIRETGIYSGAFEETEDDYVLSCHSPGANSYKDGAYKLVLESPKDVTITGSITGGGSFPSAYISLVSDCNMQDTTLSCVSGRTAEIRRRGLAAGTYFLLVEASSVASTSWTLNVEIVDPVPPPMGDTCSSPVDITSARGSVDLDMLELDSGTGCGGTSSSYRDAFFTFTTTATQDVTLTTTNSGGRNSYVALQTSCGASGSELRCRNASASTPNVQTFRSLPAGTYFVVMSTTSAAGTLGAEIELAPPTPVPPNDRCEGAVTLSNGSNLMGTLIDFEDDVTGCSFTGRPDAFYTFTLTERKAVTIIANSTGTAQVYLSLRQTCAEGRDECDNGDPAVIDATLDPGTYYLVVEQTSTTASDFTIRTFMADP